MSPTATEKPPNRRMCGSVLLLVARPFRTSLTPASEAVEPVASSALAEYWNATGCSVSQPGLLSCRVDVDDHPTKDSTPVAEWLPRLARTLGAKKPKRVPRFVGRLFAGETGVMMMTEIRGTSNAKAKRELAWRPAHPSWRQGFAAA